MLFEGEEEYKIKGGVYDRMLMEVGEGFSKGDL